MPRSVSVCELEATGPCRIVAGRSTVLRSTDAHDRSLNRNNKLNHQSSPAQPQLPNFLEVGAMQFVWLCVKVLSMPSAW
jgi:hypothetical protein